jgi:hypothetical protein
MLFAELMLGRSNLAGELEGWEYSLPSHGVFSHLVDAFWILQYASKRNFSSDGVVLMQPMQSNTGYTHYLARR